MSPCDWDETLFFGLEVVRKMVKAKTVAAILVVVLVVIVGLAFFVVRLPSPPPPKFSLLSWKVEPQFNSEAVLSIQYEVSGDVPGDSIYFQLLRPTGTTAYHETPILTGTVNLRMSGVSTPEPGRYRLTVVPYEHRGQIMFEREFSFSGAKISIENCTPTWDSYDSGYWLKEIELTLVNEGDLPVVLPNRPAEMFYRGPIWVKVDDVGVVVASSEVLIQGWLVTYEGIGRAFESEQAAKDFKNQQYGDDPRAEVTAQELRESGGYNLWLACGQRIRLSCRLIAPWQYLVTTSESAPEFQPGEHSLRVGINITPQEALPKESIGEHRATIQVP